MSHHTHQHPRAGCASLLLVAARTAAGWGAIYLADPATRLPLVQRLRLRWPLDGHTPTVTAATPTQLTRMLWAVTARMYLRYLAGLLAITAAMVAGRVAPRLAAWIASAARRRPLLVVVSKQLLPTTARAQPRLLGALLRGPLAVLAGHGRGVGILVFLDVPAGGPDDPVDLGRVGRKLEEVSLGDPAAAMPTPAGAGPRQPRGR
jgi:hypothetical protein